MSTHRRTKTREGGGQSEVPVDVLASCHNTGFLNPQPHATVKDKAAQCTCRLVRELRSRNEVFQVSFCPHTAC